MSLILSGSDGLSDVDGSAATPAIRGTDANTGIFFPAADTVGMSTGGSERVRVDSSGNVGIGTSSLSAKLQVAGNFAVQGGDNSIFRSGGNAWLYISSGTGYGTAGASIKLDNSSGNGTTIFYQGVNEAARIGSGGNVGIGRTDASDVRLLVKGVDSGATNYAFSAENSSAFSLLYLRNDKYFNSGAIASYSTAGTTLVIDGSNFVGKLTSSLRYKKDIVDYDKGLDAIVKLRPVYYKSAIEGPNGIDPKQHAGFIAEEIADEGFEEFLIRNNEGEPDAIQYAQMTALLCKAIQEQQALIQSLTARITALETP